MPTSSKTEYPYGNVAVHPDKLKVKIVTAGTYSFHVTDMEGNIIKMLHSSKTLQPGTYHMPLDKTGLAPKQYYVQMLYNDMLVAFNELEIK